jgi:serine/threonine protein kinase/formylglycine-generating enzyme required for sulfatase activity
VRQTTGTFSRGKLSKANIDGAPFKPGDIIASRYLIKDCVGQGPVAYVFRAQDKDLDVEVALKAVSPKLLQTLEERRAFAKEIKAARKLNHNNIARIYEEGEHQDKPFFTTQFLEGLSLRKIIDLRKEKGQTFKIDEIEPILAQVAAALDESHRQGVIHGDLKPENVLVLPDLLKVTDFCLGMAMPRMPFVSAQKPKKGDRYFAPEFALGGEVSSAIDIYAMGVILGEMLSGALPDGGTPADIKRINPGISGQLDSIYRKATHENPAARHPRASAFAAELAMVAGHSSPGANDGPLPTGRPTSSGTNGRPSSSATGMRPNPSSGALPRPAASDSGRFPKALASTTGTNGAVRRAPPPPPVADNDLEVTPAASRPPLPIRPATGETNNRPRPTLPPAPPTIAELPLQDIQLALPTENLQIGVPTQNFQLPDAVDANGVTSEEPTQAMSLPIDMPMGRQIPPISSIARPIERPKSNTWIVALILVVGVLIGMGGGYVYLQNENKKEADATAKRDAEEKARLLAEQQADAGRWSALVVPTPRTLVDAGPLAPPTKPPEPVVVDAGPAAVSPLAPVVVPPTAVGANGCPNGMVLIAAGAFKFGSDENDMARGWDERAFTTRTTTAYCIDTYEYPNQLGTTPMINVAYKDAEKLCTDQGKRMCGEEEWERACKGPANNRYSYGDKSDGKACSLGKTPAPSGAFAHCRSGYDVFDLTGNVAEWTSTAYAPGAGGKAVKGAPGDELSRCAGRRMVTPTRKSDNVGFRCCADAKP